jgi:hypothetical protein
VLLPILKLWLPCKVVHHSLDIQPVGQATRCKMKMKN